MSKKWTRSNPSKVILNRVQSMADTALGMLSSSCIALYHANEVEESWTRELFTCALSDYDIVIRLNPALIPLRAYALDKLCASDGTGVSNGEQENAFKATEFKNLRSIQDVVIGLNPVEVYVKDIMVCARCAMCSND